MAIDPDEEQRILGKIAALKEQVRAYEQLLATLRADGAERSPSRRRGRRTTHIVDLLRQHPEGLTRQQLAAELGMVGEEHLLSNALSYLRSDNGRVDRLDDGRWVIPQ